jgi:hypothetical protein
LGRWISGSRLAPGRGRQKAAGYELAIAAMVKSHFQKERRVGHQSASGVHREGGGIVVGVAAFISVGDNRPWLLSFQNLAETVRQGREVMHCLLIDDAETQRSYFFRSAGGQCGR